MLNILGDVWYVDASEAQREPNWPAVLSMPGVSLHLYGKREARRGRKMGHVNCTGLTLDQARETANRVVEALGLPVAVR